MVSLKNKRLWLVMVLIIFSLSMTSLLSWAANSNDASNYFPMKTSNKWHYKVTLNDKTSYDQIIQVGEPKDGQLRLIVVINGTPQVEIDYIQKETGLFKTREVSKDSTIVMEPLQMVLSAKLNIGNNWKWQSTNGKMQEKTKVIKKEQIKVPAGKFEAILIECEGVDAQGQAYKDQAWYAKGIGIVKDIYTANDGKSISQELVEHKLSSRK